MSYKTYMVGGAVRDKLLDIPLKDRDWVVIGATPEEMLQQDFQPVGKDFPVFLHPETKEEYALARTEKKQGKGYHGFVFYSSPDVTLEEDLRRRDITINAMAQDGQGNIVDPYGGQQDIKDKIIRHTSPAFIEDPLRVLRVARFAAQFSHLGFSIATETQELLASMTEEINTLSAERIWVETAKALKSSSPQVFFETLHQAKALGYWFPELERLFGVPQPEKYHPEIDCGIHTMLVLEQATLLTELTNDLDNDLAVRFAALTHDLGKGLTPKDELPSHHGHEERGVNEVKRLCNRLLVPKEITQLALLCCRYHTHPHLCGELRPDTMLKVFDAFDLWRRPHRFANLLLLCKADTRGRTGKEKAQYKRGDYFAKVAEQAQGVNPRDIIEGLSPEQIPNAIRQARLKAIEDFIVNNPRDNLDD